jgi:hypothetical protein
VSRRSGVAGAVAAAVPDGLTALAFVVVWCAPFAVGALSVKTAMLTMLLEFFLIHATGFFTAFAGDAGTPRGRRVALLLGLSLFYLLMIGAFAWSFREWWPLAAFAWLAVGKIAWTWRMRRDTPDARMTQMAGWAASVVAYLGGCLLTIMMPIPRLGMTADLQPRFGLSGSGLWIDEPHRVVAFGVVYFGLLCAGKIAVAVLAARRGATPGTI